MLKIAIIFLKYGADPFAAYRYHPGNTEIVLTAVEGLNNVYYDSNFHEMASDLEGRDELKEVIDREVAYFRSRDSYIRKRKRSPSIESRKRLDCNRCK